MSMDRLIERWDGESLVIRRARSCDATILIGIHSTALGPATGGTRMRRYESLADAAEDVMKLSAGMTLKFALGEVNRGGGKAVIRIDRAPDVDERRELMLEYGRLIKSLGGLYCTGPDSGTTPEDMNTIAEEAAPFVHGCTVERGGAGGTGYLTAVGVAAAMRAVAREKLGRDSLEGLVIAMQGAGSVGLDLIRIVTAEGAEVLVSEVNPAALTSAVEAGATSYEGDILRATCDILAPCAFGGILTPEIVPHLQCRTIVGSANNQLSEPVVASQLMEADVVYAPDFLTSMGAAIGVPGVETESWSAEHAASEVASRIERALVETIEYSDRHRTDMNSSATAIALRRLPGSPRAVTTPN